MPQEGGFSKPAAAPVGSEQINQSLRVPNWHWIVLWVLLTTVAIPAALVLSAPFAAIALWIQDLGVKAGLWSGESRSLLTMTGFVAGLALTLAFAQWYMLRNWLPRARLWFLATVAGLLLGGLIVWIGLTVIPTLSWYPVWGRAVLVMLAGAGVGFAQWLYLRQIIAPAFWIIIIDALAVGSIAFSGNTITSLIELLVLLLLPGMITGMGMWSLLRLSLPGALQPEALVTPKKRQPLPRSAMISLGLVALAPAFFACSWAYAASQLALAKNEGVYATPEEAIIGLHSQGWGGANVVKIEDIQAAPNNPNGVLPHVWFGRATIYLDRVPEGFNRSQYSAGSFYLHVRNGWVHLPEGAFPEFVGWVMALYNLEGVRQWVGGNS